MKDTYKEKRKQTTVTLPPSLIKEAKEYDINLSRTLQESVTALVKKAKEEQWKKDHQEYFDSYNSYIRKYGLPLKPHWISEEDWKSMNGKVE